MNDASPGRVERRRARRDATRHRVLGVVVLCAAVAGSVVVLELGRQSPASARSGHSTPATLPVSASVPPSGSP